MIFLFVSLVSLAFPSCFILVLHGHMSELYLLIFIWLLPSPQKQRLLAVATSNATHYPLTVLWTTKSWPVLSILAFSIELSLFSYDFICVLSKASSFIYSFQLSLLSLLSLPLLTPTGLQCGHWNCYWNFFPTIYRWSEDYYIFCFLLLLKVWISCGFTCGSSLIVSFVGFEGLVSKENQTQAATIGF